ncbi:dpy-30 domain-containing protein [Colletotrichum scovillei]|uniref:Dpy-30 domain-containing protein n=1 Tax=Colletotrichum scovillei TaxID=1209932 RepID=A0A9P7R8R9_9PEZI|nr:dpy-30 domain-containing protein [Colletotrichum scovillei]KAF4782268.1 dpy-30 domain-containing protein [Colletotrichum scovillei]KAG7050711.1 dpy-30 domain-containing protein [Colletotrichum scovillei]KAG7069755.1 dpy-30 domain-containing protein [Colletotrichum scovillei]KAG7073762.1 dpy-30 domain-containing protein [Colletotrichum scovillei]
MSNPAEPVAQEATAPADSTVAPASATTMADAASLDIPMADAGEPASSPVPIPQVAPSAPSPAPGRTGTPSRNVNGEASSRAGSVHPDNNATNFPNRAVEHGDNARMYINNHVTAALLEGMKIISKNQPANPLHVLGNFLLEESRRRNEPSA